jgi:hypothetical protein
MLAPWTKMRFGIMLSSTMIFSMTIADMSKSLKISKDNKTFSPNDHRVRLSFSGILQQLQHFTLSLSLSAN